MSDFDLHDYSDIYSLPHHVSGHHKPMSLYDRAAQFAPFAALTGYDASIKEAGRSVAEKRELSEEDKLLINQKLTYLMDHLKEELEISVLYFVPDKKKKGGSYQEKIGVLRKIDTDHNVLCFSDKTEIPFVDIMEINNPLLESLEEQED